VTNGPVIVNQESTYQPDSTWRWLGSAAMDHDGNIAIAYSASSLSIFPQLRYAGRLATDPLNVLGHGEATRCGRRHAFRLARQFEHKPTLDNLRNWF